MTEKPVEIVTVHGTHAADDADQGDKWWQSGSEFLTKLQMCIKEPLSIRPFHWDGANSEISRRQAGIRLFNELTESERKPIVIAHSHGGSLCVHALAQMLMASAKSGAQQIAGLITIGMPMLRFRPSLNIFTRFSISGLIILVIAFGLLAMFVSDILINQNAYTRAGDTEPLTRALQVDVAAYPLLGATIGIFGILWLFTWRNSRRARIYQKNEVHKSYNDIVTSLSHPRDEAINTLQKGRMLNPKIVKFGMLFWPTFAFVAIILIVLEFTSLISEGLITADYMEGGTTVGTVRDPYVFPTGTPKWGVQFDQNQEIHAKTISRVDKSASKGGRFFNQGAIFSRVHGTKLATREELVAIPLADLWAGVETGVVPTWLAPLKDPADDGIGFAFVPAGDVDTFKRAFAIAMDRVIDAGETAYLEEACRKAFFTQSAFREKNRDFLAAALFDGCRYPMDMAPKEDYMSYNVFFKAMNQQASSDIVFLTARKREGFFQVPEASQPIRTVNFPTALFAFLSAEEIPTFDEDSLVLMDNTYLETNRWSAFVGSFCNDDRPFRRDLAICQLTYEVRGRTFIHHALSFNDNFLAGLSIYIPGFESLYQYLSGSVLTKDTEGGDLLVIQEGFSILDLVRLLVNVVVIVVIAAFASMWSLSAAPVLQGFLVDTLKKKSYGNDGHGETLVDVLPGIDFEVVAPGNLPESVEAEINANSERDAPAAIERLRNLLAKGDIGALGDADALSTAMSFDKSELIHNAYFHSDRFIKYLAAVLVTRYGLTPSDEMLDDQDGSDFLETLAWSNIS